MKTINLPNDNVGGISAIYLTATDNILLYHRDYDSVQLELIDKEAIIMLPYQAGDTYRFSEKMTIEEGGPTFEVTIEGVMPTASSTSDTTIREIISKQWLALAKDNNGHQRLVGSLDVPLSFSFDYSTGQKGERNGMTCSVSSKQDHGSFPWNGPFVRPLGINHILFN